jgi:hypothetical protein
MGGNKVTGSWVLMDVGASLSGRRPRGRITPAFGPGYNMTGLRPCRAGVDSAAGEVDRSEQWRVGKRVQQGKGGGEAAKPTGFSRLETALTRLFPHKSTQVVDFPHMAMVRLSCGRPEMGSATDGTRDGGGWQWAMDKGQWIAENGGNSGEIHREPREKREWNRKTKYCLQKIRNSTGRAARQV